MVDKYRGMIRQKSSVLLTETKLSAAGGPAGVAIMHKAIAESRRINVQTIVMKYNSEMEAEQRRVVDRWSSESKCAPSYMRLGFAKCQAWPAI